MRELNMKSSAYEAGHRAFVEGRGEDANSHRVGVGTSGGFNMKRAEWFDGFYDARITRRLGPIFAKYDESWC